MDQALAARSFRAISGAVGRSLRIRGFFRRREGLYYRLADGVCQLVRVDGAPGPTSWQATVQVALAVLPLEASQRETGAGADPAAGELSLWDLVPGRERGGAWAVTEATNLDAVAADVVEVLERYGLPRIETSRVVEPRTTRRQRAISDRRESITTG